MASTSTLYILKQAFRKPESHALYEKNQKDPGQTLYLSFT